MQKPLLQVALDHTNLPAALRAAKVLASEVEVMEVGTILCYAEGIRAVSAVKAVCPKHIVCADLKAADAGYVAANLAFKKGADWMTCICNAPIPTMRAALEEAKKHGGDVQVELYGDWTYEHAAQWKKIGLKQVVYHRGRDAQAAGRSWGNDDLVKIKRLVEMGFEVSVTGGLTPSDLTLFKGIPVRCLISGRSLYEAEDPVLSARAFKKAIAEHWC